MSIFTAADHFVVRSQGADVVVTGTNGHVIVFRQMDTRVPPTPHLAIRTEAAAVGSPVAHTYGGVLSIYRQGPLAARKESVDARPPMKGESPTPANDRGIGLDTTGGPSSRTDGPKTGIRRRRFTRYVLPPASRHAVGIQRAVVYLSGGDGPKFANRGIGLS